MAHDCTFGSAASTSGLTLVVSGSQKLLSKKRGLNVSRTDLGEVHKRHGKRRKIQAATYLSAGRKELVAD